MQKLFSIIFICSLFYSVNLSAQNKKVILKTDDKLSRHGFSFWFDVQVKSADTSFYYLLHSQKKDVFEVSKPGTYTLIFHSVFGHTHTQSFVVGDKKSVKVKVKGLAKAYSEVSTTMTLCDKMQANDTVYIISSTAGAIEYEKLGVVKLADGRYKALQFVGLTTDVFQEFTVSANEFEQIINIEKNVKLLSIKSSCAPNVYTIMLRRQYYTTLDKSCLEKTIDLMKAVLFLIKGK